MKAIVLLSGGVDSMACVNVLLKRNFDVSAFFFDYGHISNKVELSHAKNISSYYGIDLNIQRLTSGSNFGEGEILGRNAFLVFAALMYSELRNGLIALGIHRGVSYYDCSHQFFSRASVLVSEYSKGRIGLVAPFIDWTKKDIFDYCFTEGIPLTLTYSCERGEDPPCRQCLSCKDRMAYQC